MITRRFGRATRFIVHLPAHLYAGCGGDRWRLRPRVRPGDSGTSQPLLNAGGSSRAAGSRRDQVVDDPRPAGTPPETANPSEGESTLLAALGVALGIAAGATLGTYLGRPIADQLRHIPTRPRRRRPSVAAERL
jgi:hypothetical protein